MADPTSQPPAEPGAGGPAALCEGPPFEVWHSRFGDIRIEVIDDRIWVNGEIVEPVADLR